MNVGILDHDDFRKLVEERLLAAAVEHAPEYPVQIDNEPFVQPDSGRWLSICTKLGESSTKSIGHQFIERTPGFIQIDVMVPKDSGNAAPRRLGHALADVLNHRKLSRDSVTATFWKKSVDTGPVVGSFFRIMARVFFYYDGYVERPATGQ